MAFKDKIANVVKRLETVRSGTDQGEEATKARTILPLLKAWEINGSVHVQ